MRIERKRNVLLMVCFALCFVGYGQEEKDKLVVKVVDIVKSYSASILDARKIPQATPQKDSISLGRKEIKYDFISVPVASTFVPEKGNAAKFSSTEVLRSYYNSYVAFGVGIKSNLVGDSYISLPINEYSNLGFNLEHNSMQKSVEGTKIDNNYSNTFGKISYKFKEINYELGSSVNAGHRLHYLYGHQNKDFDNPLNIDFSNNYIDLGADVYFTTNNSFLESINVGYQHTRESGFDERESEFKSNAVMSFPIGEQLLVTHLDASYQVVNQVDYKKTNLLLGVIPYYNYIKDYLEVNVGAGAYFVDNQEKEKIRIYPKIDVSYVLVDMFIPYAGVTGEVRQNTLREISTINPYISNKLLYIPTYTPFDAFLGFRGSMSSNFSYDLKAHFSKFKDMPFYRLNYYNPLSDYDIFGYKNSFGIIFDDGTLYGLSGGISLHFTDVLTSNIRVKTEKYDLDTQKKAWNVPNVQMDMSLDVKILKNWFLGADLIYKGERWDVVNQAMVENGFYADGGYMHYNKWKNIDFSKDVPINKKGYFDLNFRTDFSVTQQWTVFLNANNVLGENYQHWHNYPVHGFQAFGGIKYQFKLEKK